MKVMTYKGYTAEIHYRDENGFFVGDVVGIDDIICFHGDADEKLRAAFEDVVDLYIEALEEAENLSQKCFAGRVAVASTPSTPSVKTEHLSSLLGIKPQK